MLLLDKYIEHSLFLSWVCFSTHYNYTYDCHFHTDPWCLWDLIQINLLKKTNLLLILTFYRCFFSARQKLFSNIIVCIRNQNLALNKFVHFGFKNNSVLIQLDLSDIIKFSKSFIFNPQFHIFKREGFSLFCMVFHFK